jgi:hypothetical protein
MKGLYMHYLMRFSLFCALLPSYPATARSACPPHKHIRTWSREHILHNGFNIVEQGGQAAISYPNHHVRLALTADPSTSITTIARITEGDSFCWQPTNDHPVIMQITLRFDQATPPPNLTEVAFLWNAPDLTQRLPSVVGISRDHGAYTAIVAQDFNPATGDGLFLRAPVPSWLNATNWHTIRIELTITSAQVQVEQGGRQATIVTGTLLHPPEPLAAEVSIDNDNFPEGHLPVIVSDKMDVRFLGIQE